MNTYGVPPEDLSMTIERDRRFGIFVSFKNCLGFEIKVKTFWYSCLSVNDNLKVILD